MPTPSSPSIPKPVLLLLNIWIIVPVIAYFYCVNMTSMNMPNTDDYEVILQFLCEFKKADFPHRLALLFSQINEHRILSSRIVYVIYYSIFGDVNFKTLAFIGNMQFVLVFIIIGYFIKKAVPRYWKIAVFAFGLCIFDLNDHDNIPWAMGSMQNYGVLLLFMASMFFYHLGAKWKFLLPAALLQIMCIFSSGNGMLGAFCLVVFTLFTKNKTIIITSLLAFLIFSPLYFLHYESTRTELHAASFQQILVAFFDLSGAHFPRAYMLVAGIVVWVSLVVLLYSKKRDELLVNLPFICIILFSLITIFVISVARGVDENRALASRYFIYPNMLAGIILIFLLQQLQQNIKRLVPVYTITLAFMAAIYFINYSLDAPTFGFQYLRLVNSDYNHDNPAKAKIIADEACSMEIYCLEEERLQPVYFPGIKHWKMNTKDSTIKK